MGWILKLLLTKRVMRSAVRYGLVALATFLAARSDMIPGLAPLAEFLTLNTDTLAELLSVALYGAVGVWSLAKNNENEKVQMRTSMEVK